MPLPEFLYNAIAHFRELGCERRMIIGDELGSDGISRRCLRCYIHGAQWIIDEAAFQRAALANITIQLRTRQPTAFTQLLTAFDEDPVRALQAWMRDPANRPQTDAGVRLGGLHYMLEREREEQERQRAATPAPDYAQADTRILDSMWSALSPMSGQTELLDTVPPRSPGDQARSTERTRASMERFAALYGTEPYAGTEDPGEGAMVGYQAYLVPPKPFETYKLGDRVIQAVDVFASGPYLVGKTQVAVPRQGYLVVADGQPYFMDGDLFRSLNPVKQVLVKQEDVLDRFDREEVV